MNALNNLMKAANLLRFEKLLATECYLVMVREQDKVVNKVYTFATDEFGKYRQTYFEKEAATEAFQRTVDQHEKTVLRLISQGLPLDAVATEALKKAEQYS